MTETYKRLTRVVFTWINHLFHKNIESWLDNVWIFKTYANQIVHLQRDAALNGVQGWYFPPLGWFLLFHLFGELIMLPILGLFLFFFFCWTTILCLGVWSERISYDHDGNNYCKLHTNNVFSLLKFIHQKLIVISKMQQIVKHNGQLHLNSTHPLWKI